MATQTRPYIAPDVYLALERAAPHKSEYHDGEIVAMAGASRRHNLIVANLVRLLGNALLDRDCNVYPSDLRVRTAKGDLYTYPDVTITCGEERFEDGHADTLLTPLLLIEVLSESTEGYDRGKKFEHYQRISSLKEYMLVAQDRCRAEQFVRQQDGRWIYSEAHRQEDVILLSSIACDVALKEVYAKVRLEEASR
ncbi:MAG: Uma2 family endonuclease [Rhodothermales bacterium]